MTVREMIAQMTLEEKADLCAGTDMWRFTPPARFGLRPVMMSDGPHGLRTQKQKGDILGMYDSIQSVCFPTAAGTACSFDRGLLRHLGSLLGEECRAEGVDILLGPAANIKRSPLCGRNFEYFSEDPCLSSAMAEAYIRGVQSHHVGTSLKHFAVNNQESRRMTVSAQADARTLREIYLASFEGAVRRAKPWTVMCSYNRINGTYASENRRLLTDVLRRDWGFEGLVMTDWGACNDRVRGLEAGQDLQMPGPDEENGRTLVQAVRAGTLEEAVLDRAVERILTAARRAAENGPVPGYDHEAHHREARVIARESMVLLQNGGTLPLKKDAPVAFIGEFAKKPRYQGGGSSHIHAFRVADAWSAALASGEAGLTYARGFGTDADQTDEALVQQAVETARNASAAVIFAGLPESWESEGFDRTHMRLPDCQNRVIEAVAAVQPHTVVVLHNGAPVEMPWAGRVDAILEAYLGGEAVGEAVADLLFGDANPCGKLAETFPLRLEDTPSYLSFPGQGDTVDYSEGLFVGYRWYDSRRMPVRFPFGHGLSYTTFAYRDLRLDRDCLKAGEALGVRLTVTNTGARAGKEIVQLYVRDGSGKVIRPDRELRDFARVALEPGQSCEVAFTLDARAFACYDPEGECWRVPAGTYEILVGRSSRDIPLSAAVRVDAPPFPLRVTANTPVGELLAHPATAQAARDFLARLFPNQPPLSAAPQAQSALQHALLDAPLRAFQGFSNGRLTRRALGQMIDDLNARVAQWTEASR